MKNKYIRQIFSILMCFALVFSMIPTTAFAWDEDDTCEFCGREIHVVGYYDHKSKGTTLTEEEQRVYEEAKAFIERLMN